jgi:acyl-CoA thioesterase
VATAPRVTGFDRDTAVAPLGDGRYATTIAPDWSTPRGPNGGYVAALLLRALTAEVDDPARAPRSLTCHYLRPPAIGEAEVHVTVERAGRSLTTLTARLVQDDRPVTLAIAAFATEFPTLGAYASPAPEAPDWQSVEVTPPHAEAPSIAQRIEARPVFGAPLFSGAGEALGGGWLRLAEPRAADAIAVALYTDAWTPSPWPRFAELTPAPTVDLTIHFRRRLPVEGLDPAAPLLGRFQSTTAHDGFFEEDGALWTPDGTLVAQSRQLGILLPL